MRSIKFDWVLAKRLYTCWRSAHGLAYEEKAWDQLDDWAKGYWFSVAEFVLDHFDPKDDQFFYKF